ncbi:MAG: indole-3-glycerol phosphate synthase [Bacteroidota bacterium]|nr:indole-3-glycerol phosphate synthase [Bacteroidota bacterium]
MTILDKIIVHKKNAIEEAKRNISIEELEATVFFCRNTISLTENLLADNSSGIIAEFKRRSPSKGILNAKADVVEVVKQYENAGVAGSSILTEEEFFNGSSNDLIAVRNKVNIPLLRKDFMIDEYQFIEAKSWGADVVLLIAAILTPQQVKQFTGLAKNLGLEVLLELHDESELDHVNDMVDMVGINNRNLKTFEVDIEQSIRMAEKLGNDVVKVAESGISDLATMKLLKQNGFHGFLIGENFMKTDNPGLACRNFIQSVQLK